MLIHDRQALISKLTGIQSSKKSYYHELKIMVKELQKKNMQLEVINEVTQSINVDMSIDDMLKNIFEKLISFFSLAKISLSIYENNQLTLVNSYPSTANYFPIGYKFPEKNSLYWKAIHSSENILYKFQGQKNSYVEEEEFATLGIQSILILPLVRKKRIIGVLSIGSKIGNHFNHTDLSFFQQLSDQIAVCVENVQLYQKVFNAKKEWEETFRAVSDMLFVTDKNWTILKYNRCAKKYFKKNILGKNLGEILNQPLNNDLSSIDENYYKEFFHNQHLFEMRAYPIYDNHHQMHSYIIYMIDITEKRKMEAQLIQSAKLAAIGEIAAGIAHELNNPLTVILGNSQLLLRYIAEQDRNHKLLADIYTCGKRCKTIIQNLLTFSRQDEYIFEQFSINEAVEQVTSIITDQLKKENITLQKNLTNDLPLIYGNTQQIGQIVLNLVINARDALEKKDAGEKQITIETKELLENEQTYVTLIVRDNGTGIEQKYLQEIFNPFFTTKPPKKGTGLGLSVSLGIAETHKGTIKVKSDYKKGSEFILCLPVNQE